MKMKLRYRTKDDSTTKDRKEELIDDWKNDEEECPEESDSESDNSDEDDDDDDDNNEKELKNTDLVESFFDCILKVYYFIFIVKLSLSLLVRTSFAYWLSLTFATLHFMYVGYNLLQKPIWSRADVREFAVYLISMTCLVYSFHIVFEVKIGV
jgi:cation transport ATPase